MQEGSKHLEAPQQPGVSATAQPVTGWGEGTPSSGRSVGLDSLFISLQTHIGGLFFKASTILKISLGR